MRSETRTQTATDPRSRPPGWVRSALCASLVAMIVAAVVVAAPSRAAAGSEHAAPVTLTVGDIVPETTLRDQHGAETKIDASLRRLLLTRDMDAGAVVKEVLGEDGREKLAAAGALYVSDVSGMPGFVRRMFALPGLRKRPYAIVLDEDGKATASLPYQAGHVTILALDGGRIESVAYAATADELRSALQP